MRLQRRAVDQHTVRLFDAKGGPVEAKRAARARLLAYPHPRSESRSSCGRSGPFVRVAACCAAKIEKAARAFP